MNLQHQSHFLRNTIAIVFGVILFLSISNNIYAATKNLQSDYSGQQNRLIKSLSKNDIKQLQQGKGWGLAKAAELNGIPGPKHLLEMKTEINLSPIQQRKITELYNKMKQQAIVNGLLLIKLEQHLNTLFAENTITAESLDIVLTKISIARKNLRLVHLSTHLKTPEILSPHQIQLYNKLRGYSSKGYNSKKHDHSH